MKNIITALVVSSLLATLGAAQQRSDVYDRSDKQGADEAAAQALRNLTALAQTNYRALGFDSVDQARAARLGQPVGQFVIELDRLKSYQPGTEASQLLTSTQTLIYPVVVENRTRSSVTVSRRGGRWQAVSFGNPTYVKALTEVRDRQASAPADSEAFEVRIPALNLMFLGHRENSKVILSPIFDEARFGFRRGEALSLDDVLQKILPAAREHNGLPT